MQNKTLKIKNQKDFTARIFTKILYKTNFCDKKGNQQLLEIDLLKAEIQKELLSISLLRVEEIYSKLLERKDPASFMQKRGELLFIQCIKKSTEDFLTKQYGYTVKINLYSLRKLLYTQRLLKDVELIFQLPFYVLTDAKSPNFFLTFYPVYSFASENFIEALIDNMILEISNCVVHYSMVKFSSAYAFRQTLYRAKFLSLRNFERFKNNLSWKLITNIYIQRPIDLYNNRYRIFILRTNGIYYKTVYANRSKELGYLNSISLLTITFVELRDFFTSRIDEIIYYVSKAIRFTLTSVFGQVVGLVWRGIIEGLKK